MALNAMLYAYHADLQAETHKPQAFILDRLDHLMSLPNSLGPECHWSETLLNRPMANQNWPFLEFAAVYSLTGYVRRKFVQVGEEPAHMCASHLLHVLLPRTRWGVRWHLPLLRVEMVSLLLNLGANPNHISPDSYEAQLSG
jgi:hypothetical protein